MQKIKKSKGIKDLGGKGLIDEGKKNVSEECEWKGPYEEDNVL